MLNLNNIKNLSKKEGITLRDLAKKIGITEPGLHKMISLNATNTKTLTKIATALNVTEAEFFIKPYQENETASPATDKSANYGDPNIWKRIGILQAHKDVDQVGFSNLLKISPKTYSAMRVRKTEPGFKFIKAIYRLFPKLNPSWLLYGEGNMMLDDKKNGKCDCEKNELIIANQHDLIIRLKADLRLCHEREAKLLRSEVKKGKVG